MTKPRNPSQKGGRPHPAADPAPEPEAQVPGAGQAAGRLGTPPRRHPAAPPENLVPFQERLERIESAVTVPRILLVAGVLLAVLVPSALYVRRAEIAGVLAERALVRQDWAGAEANLRRQYADRPMPVPVLLTRARCLLELKKDREALADLDTALAKIDQIQGSKENQALLHGLRARALLALKQDGPALESAQKALVLDPKLVIAHAVAAEYHVRRNEPFQAGDSFEHLANHPEYKALVEQFHKQLDAKEAQIPQAQLADVPEFLPAADATASTTVSAARSAPVAARPSVAGSAFGTAVARPSTSTAPTSGPGR